MVRVPCGGVHPDLPHERSMRKDDLHILQELWLVLFDHHNVVAPSVHDLLGHLETLYPPVEAACPLLLRKLHDPDPNRLPDDIPIRVYNHGAVEGASVLAGAVLTQVQSWFALSFPSP